MGKKFSAAEKHFNDKTQKFKKELERLRIDNIDLTEKQLQQTSYDEKMEQMVASAIQKDVHERVLTATYFF